MNSYESYYENKDSIKKNELKNNQNTSSNLLYLIILYFNNF